MKRASMRKWWERKKNRLKLLNKNQQRLNLLSTRRYLSINPLKIKLLNTSLLSISPLSISQSSLWSKNLLSTSRSRRSRASK